MKSIMMIVLLSGLVTASQKADSQNQADDALPLHVDLPLSLQNPLLTSTGSTTPMPMEPLTPPARPSADSNNAPKAANDQKSEADFLRMFGETSPKIDRQKKIAAALEEQKDDFDEINEEDFAKQTEIKVPVDDDHSSRMSCRCGRCYPNVKPIYRLEKHVLPWECKKCAEIFNKPTVNPALFLICKECGSKKP